MTRVDIAICTWNRARLLDATLESLVRLRIPNAIRWRVLVVNNNCTDDTDEVIERHVGRIPVVRLLQPEQGHCAARNCAMDAADCDLLLWTDDDVIVDPMWLAEYVAIAERWPSATFFAGRVDPWFEVEPTAAMAAALSAVAEGFCGIDLGDSERLLVPPECPKGANMAYRMDQVRPLRFDTNHGIKGTVQTRADEQVFCEAITRCGGCGVWAPRARLKHFVPADRMGRRYLRDFYFGLGKTYVRRGELAWGRTVAGVPRWLLRRYAAAWIARFEATVRNDCVRHYRALADVWRISGMIDECRASRGKSASNHG